MKRLFLLIFAFAACCTTKLCAQQDNGGQPLKADTLKAGTADTLLAPLPPALDVPFMPAAGFDALSPSLYGAYGPSWRLHEGFNAQFGMSLSAAFGHGAPRGVGFGQHAAFAYALPAGKRLSFAAGVYAANMDWGGLRRTEGGVAGIIGYRLSDAVSLYAYATKRFTPDEYGHRCGMFPVFLYEPKERIGAMAEIKLGKSAMIQVSVERDGY